MIINDSGFGMVCYDCGSVRVDVSYDDASELIINFVCLNCRKQSNIEMYDKAVKIDEISS